MVSYSNNVYKTCNNSKKKNLPLLKQEKVSSFYQSEFVFINFFSFKSLYMAILILLPLDGHNFKIITKLLQNNSFLFMKTINEDLVPREFFLLIRWNMRIIYRN